MTPEQQAEFSEFTVRQLGIWLFYPSGKYQGHSQRVPKQEQGLSVDYDTLDHSKWGNSFPKPFYSEDQKNLNPGKATTVSEYKGREDKTATHNAERKG